MRDSLLEYYFPNFQLADCEVTTVGKELMLLTFEVGEVAFTLAIHCDTENRLICI